MKLVLKNVNKLAKGPLTNIFQDSLNKILSQQLTHDRSYMSAPTSDSAPLLHIRKPDHPADLGQNPSSEHNLAYTIFRHRCTVQTGLSCFLKSRKITRDPVEKM